MSVISSTLYSSPDYYSTTNHVKANQDPVTVSSENQPKDSYESSTNIEAASPNSKDALVIVLGVGPKLTEEDVFAPGFQPKDEREALAAAYIIHSHIENKHGVKFDEIPTTASGKKAYNQAAKEFIGNQDIQKLRQEWSHVLVPNPSLLSSLNKVEGTNWWISDGAEALIGNHILQKLEIDYSTAEQGENQYGKIDQSINEYGFKVTLPGKYNNTNFLSTTFVDPLTGNSKQIPVAGADGGTTYKPNIDFIDALGLTGMSLSDRKIFLSSVQSILDQVAPGLDVRQLKFKTGYMNSQDQQSGKLSILLDTTGNEPVDQVRDRIEKAINQNQALVQMKLKADQSGNQTSGKLTISPLDTNDKELPKDQVRLTAGGKSMIVSVAQIMDMDQMQMLSLVGAA